MDSGHTRTYMQNTSEQTWERGHMSLDTNDNHLSGADTKMTIDVTSNVSTGTFKQEDVDKYKHVK